MIATGSPHGSVQLLTVFDCPHCGQLFQHRLFEFMPPVVEMKCRRCGQAVDLATDSCVAVSEKKFTVLVRAERFLETYAQKA